MIKKKFKRSPRSHTGKRTDSKGTVLVSIQLRTSAGEYVKGNLFRGLTVRNAKVSDVVAMIEAALFEDAATA